MDNLSELALCELLDEEFTEDDGRLICDEGDAFVLEGAGQLTLQVLERILHCMLFALPHEYAEQSFIIMPNPVSRFCLDLRATTDRPPTNWFRNRKLQKYARDFTVVVKTDLRSDLQIAKAYHESRNGDTWITPQLMQLLHQLSSRRDVVQCFSFSLVSKACGQTAAVCLGFASGGVYQDYTMCTPQMGISIWYWGYRMEYMEEYTSYGAREFGRQEFNDVLRQCAATTLLPPSSITLPEMIALDVQAP